MRAGGGGVGLGRQAPPNLRRLVPRHRERPLSWEVVTGRLRERGCFPKSRKEKGRKSPTRGWQGIGVETPTWDI
jgi:hypothetical protein